MYRSPVVVLLACMMGLADAHAQVSAGDRQAAAVKRVSRLAAQGETLWPAGRRPAPEVDPQSANKVAVETAKAEDSATRRRGIEGLALTAPSQNLDALISGLGDSDPVARESARTGLAKCDRKVVLDRILTVVCGGAPMLEKPVGSALPGLKDLLEEPLIGVLESPTETDTHKAGAGYCLGRMKSSIAIPLLADAAFASGPENALVYVDALFAIQDPLAIPRIEELAAHPAPEVRKRVVRGLADLGSPEGFGALGRIAVTPPGGDDSISRKAVTLLGDSQKPEVVPMLVFALEHNPAVENNAVAALRKIAQEDYGTDAKEWLNWYNRRQGLPPVPDPDEEEGTTPKVLGDDDDSDRQMANDNKDAKKGKKSLKQQGEDGAKGKDTEKKRGGVRGLLDKLKPKPKPSRIPKPEKVHFEGVVM